MSESESQRGRRKPNPIASDQSFDSGLTASPLPQRTPHFLQETGARLVQLELQSVMYVNLAVSAPPCVLAGKLFDALAIATNAVVERSAESACHGRGAAQRFLC